MYRNTYVEVNLDNIKSNVKNIIKNYNKYNYFIGVVKGNAYGHGYYTVKALIESGINYLAVSTLEEALQVRKWALETPILLLQPIDIEHINVCLQNNITITVCDYSYFEELLTLSLKKALKFHLKLDTGMNRLGISSEKEIKKIYDKISNNKHIILEGIYTHMGTSGLNDKNWDNQLNRFKELTKSIPLDKIPIVHIDRSLTMMMHDKISFCNGVRLGIAMFGYNQVPSIGHGLKSKLRNLKNELKRSFLSISKPVINNMSLKPALSLYSEIIQIKKVDKNQFIGYGTTYKTKEDVIVATISIGYADGLVLKNSGRFVVINNKRYQVVGSINMGMISVLVDKSVKVHDKVVIIGEGISIREVSRYLNTTIYEVMTTINPNIPRVYIENNKIVNIQELDR